MRPRAAGSRLAILTAILGLAVLAALGGGWQVFLARDGSATLGFSADAVGGRLVVTEVARTTTWERPTQAAAAGLELGDRLVSAREAGGREVQLRGIADLGDVVRRSGLSPWTLVVQRSEADRAPRQLSLQMVPSSPPWSVTRALLLVLLRIVLPLVAIGGAAFVGFTRPANDLAFLASLVLLGTVALVGSSAFSLPPGLREAALAFTWVGFFFPYLLLTFFLRFPRRARLDERWPWLKGALLAALVPLAVFFFARTLAVYYDASRDPLVFLGARALSLQEKLGNFYSALSLSLIGLAIATLVGHLRAIESPAERRRLRVLLSGVLVALVPLVVLVLFELVTEDVPAWALFLAVGTIWLFPAALVYVVLNDRVFGVRLILRRGLQYTLLSSGLLILGGVIFGLTYALASPWIAGQLPASWSGVASAVSLLFAFFVALGLRSAYRRVMPTVDRAFFRDQYNAQRILGELGAAARRLSTQPDRLLETVAEKVQDALHPDHVAIFVRCGAAPWLAGNARASGGDTAVCLIHATASRDGRWIFRPEDLEAEDAEPAPAALITALDSVPILERDAFDVSETGTTWRRARGPATLTAASEPAVRAFLSRHNARLLIPLNTSEQMIGFLLLGEKLSEEPYTRDDRELLAAVSGQVAIALDNARLVGEVAERERLRREIEIAQEVQAQLFPQSMPPLATFSYFGVCRAARGVGGDYFDFVPIGPGRLGIAVGDVAGKGISAALLMATLQGALRSHAPLHGETICSLLADVNRLMCSSVSGGRFASFFYAVYDDVRRRLVYANAGHNPPFVIRPAQDGRPPELLRLGATGMVVGIFPEEVYEQRELPLLPGDLVVIYTDGLTEAQAQDGEQFGEGRLADLATACSHLSVEEASARILSEIDAFVGDAPQQDDITLIVGKVL